MARQIQPSRSRVRQLRRLWPYVLMAWERWQQLTPEEKERYKKQARDYAERGRKTIAERRKRRGR
jgi:glycogen debranching enzyme